MSYMYNSYRTLRGGEDLAERTHEVARVINVACQYLMENHLTHAQKNGVVMFLASLTEGLESDAAEVMTVKAREAEARAKVRLESGEAVKLPIEPEDLPF